MPSWTTPPPSPTPTSTTKQNPSAPLTPEGSGWVAEYLFCTKYGQIQRCLEPERSVHPSRHKDGRDDYDKVCMVSHSVLIPARYQRKTKKFDDLVFSCSWCKKKCCVSHYKPACWRSFSQALPIVISIVLRLQMKRFFWCDDWVRVIFADIISVCSISFSLRIV